MELAVEAVGFLAATITILALLWDLHRGMSAFHRDMAALRQDAGDIRARVSRVEGMLAGAGLKAGPDAAAG